MRISDWSSDVCSSDRSATTYESVAISGAPGQFKTQILNMDIGAGVETIKDGEVFTITGVYAYDNRSKKALSHLQQFRVVGDWRSEERRVGREWGSTCRSRWSAHQ